MPRFELLAWLGGIAVSVASAILITRHYMQRSVTRKLGVYLESASSVFADVNEEVREALKISYRDKRVDELWSVELLIINEGDLAIRDYLEPLTLDLPLTVEVVEATITDRLPNGLKAELEVVSVPDCGPRLKMDFRLLNPEDWFRVKLLLNGSLEVKPAAWQLQIRGENLDTNDIRVKRAQALAGRQGSAREFAAEWMKTAYMIGWMIGAAAIAFLLLTLLGTIGVDIALPVDVSSPLNFGLSTLIILIALTGGRFSGFLLVDLLFTERGFRKARRTFG